MRGPEDYVNKEKFRESEEYKNNVVPTFVFDLVDIGLVPGEMEPLEEYFEKVKSVADFRKYCKKKGFDKMAIGQAGEKFDIEKIIEAAENDYFASKKHSENPTDQKFIN